MKRFLSIALLAGLVIGTSAATSVITANAVVQASVAAADIDGTLSPVLAVDTAFKPKKGGSKRHKKT